MHESNASVLLAYRVRENTGREAMSLLRQSPLRTRVALDEEAHVEQQLSAFADRLCPYKDRVALGARHDAAGTASVGPDRRSCAHRCASSRAYAYHHYDIPTDAQAT